METFPLVSSHTLPGFAHMGKGKIERNNEFSGLVLFPFVPFKSAETEKKITFRPIFDLSHAASNRNWFIKSFFFYF